MRQPYYANTLIKVQLPVQTVPTPGEDRNGVVLFPMPSVEASGRLTSPNVSFDTGTWFVHDELASTLPARCPSQIAAQRLADTWINNRSTGTVDPSKADQVVRWCKWFVEAHPDCAVFAPLSQRPAFDAMTSTAPVWPSGTDTEAAVELTSTLPALDEQSEASPDEGQAPDEVTEEAS